MRWLSMFLLLAVIGMLFLGQGIRDREGSNYDINNVTSEMDWNFNYTESNNSIVNVAYKGADFFGYSFLELGKGAVKYGFNHPEYDFNLAFEFVKMICITLVVIALLPALPIIFGTLYLLYEGIKSLYLFIKKKTLHKEEKE